MKIKTVVTDVDGVLTTGRFFYDATGKIMKEFGPHDADGVKMLKDANVNVIAITADHRGFNITDRRMTDMCVELIEVNEHNRLDVLKRRFDRETTAFVADGRHDAPALKWFSTSYAPANATPEAREAATYILNTRAAEGCLLEIATRLLNGEGPSTYDLILSELKQFNDIFRSKEYAAALEYIINFIALSCADDANIIGLATGRMGLTLRAFIMRLTHMGARAAMIGDTNLTACDAKTLVVINSSSGQTPSIALLAQRAHQVNAKILLITANPDSVIGRIADAKLVYPHVASQQPMKTLYEQFTFLLFDTLVVDVCRRLEISNVKLSERHSNLE